MGIQRDHTALLWLQDACPPFLGVFCFLANLPALFFTG